LFGKRGESISVEVIFTDLYELAEPKSRVSRVRRYDAWEAIPYETGYHKGTMLMTMQEGAPEPVSFDLNLYGWYKIYFGVMAPGCPVYTYFKLDGDVTYSPLASRSAGHVWAEYEFVQEILWRCENLNGQKLIMKHPKTYVKESSCLMWIRCVPMTDDEVAEYRALRETRGEYRIHAHIDTDFGGHDDIQSPDDALLHLQGLKNTDVTMCTQEVSIDYSGYYEQEICDSFVPGFVGEKLRAERFYRFHPMRKEIYKRMVDYCKSIGVRLHAGMRMEMGSFITPYDVPNFRLKFVDEHPEYRICSRDGHAAGALSYAYPEVQDHMISMLVDAFRQGFEGITLLWIRGTSFGFEKPVLDRISQLYPDIDGRRLTAEDPRLHGVWCEFMTEFMRKLRRALDGESQSSGRPRCNVHSVGCYTLKDNRLLGSDIEAWAREGLIDGFTAGMYSHYEDLSGCMSDDEPELIDLDKYDVWQKDHYIVRRRVGMEYDIMFNDIEAQQKIADEYGLEAFYTVNWEKSPPSVYANEAAEIYKRGGKGVFTWDTNARVCYPPEWAGTSVIGHKDMLPKVMDIYNDSRKSYRLLKFGDNDIRYINVNWRG
jgi:hypothetical protein